MRLPTAREVKTELARRSLGHYVELTSNIQLHRWQWDLCEILERFKDEKGLRLLIHGPPQFGKSLPMTKRMPAWLLGHNPDTREVVCAYNARQASLLTAPVREIMRSPEHLAVFPDPQGHVREPSGEAAFYTNLRFSRADGQLSLRAVSIEQGFTGSGADDVLVDDPYRSMRDARSPTVNRTTCEFIPEGVLNRVSDTANVGMMFHRYHDADAAGELLGTGKWEEFRFPLIADGGSNDPTTQWRGIGEILSPLRTIEWAKEQEEADPSLFASMMQGTPLPASGRLIDPSWFNVIDRIPRLTRWVRYYDLATSKKQAADFTAGALVGIGENGRIVIADLTRWKREWPDTRDGVRNEMNEVLEPGIVHVVQADLDRIARMFDAGIGEKKPAYHFGIESQGMQLALVQDLQRNDLFLKVPFWAENASGKGDKKERASTWAARAKAGLVDIVRGPWNQPFLAEAKVFDGLGLTHDDQIDAISGAVELLYAKTGSEVKTPELPQQGSLGYYQQLAKQQRKR